MSVSPGEPCDFLVQLWGASGPVSLARFLGKIPALAPLAAGWMRISRLSNSWHVCDIKRTFSVSFDVALMTGELPW